VSLRVALVGCGAWGINLLRALAENERARVVAVADPRAARLAASQALAPNAVLCPTLEGALAQRPDAVVIATPPAMHASHAIAAMEAGADVLVEKPLATSVADAEACVEHAARLGRIAMVGHLMLFHAAVARMIEVARSGELGAPIRLESTRISTRGPSGDSTLWTLAPHDFSILHALDSSPLAEVDVRVAAGSDRTLVDVTLTSGFRAHLILSREGPSRARKLSIVGAQHTAALDDVRAPDRVTLEPSSRVLPVVAKEPLSAEIEHFLACVATRSAPRAPVEQGALVVRWLAEAEASTRRTRAGMTFART
jgi:predicted dehydrogenase